MRKSKDQLFWRTWAASVSAAAHLWAQDLELELIPSVLQPLALSSRDAGSFCATEPFTWARNSLGFEFHSGSSVLNLGNLGVGRHQTCSQTAAELVPAGSTIRGRWLPELVRNHHNS